jgi:hypothetical protein
MLLDRRGTPFSILKIQKHSLCATTITTEEKQRIGKILLHEVRYEVKPTGEH